MKKDIWLIVILFPILMTKEVITFINTDTLSPYWLIVPLLISIAVLLKSNIARWIMLLGIYLSLFYELIGTSSSTGITICFTQNLTVLKEDWTFSTFLALLPYLAFTLSMHIFFIYLLSNKSNNEFFKLKKDNWVYETIIIGSIAFFIIYLDVIYMLFLR